MISKSLIACLFLLLLTPYVVDAAVVSLYMPDTPAIAISADVIGVEGSQTTWRLSPGQPSGTLSSVPFPAVTLVEGPDSAHVKEAQDGAEELLDCGIKDGVAVCTVVLSASGTATTLAVTTETMSDKALAVQITGIPKNGAGKMTGSNLVVAGVIMGVVCGIMA